MKRAVQVVAVLGFGAGVLALASYATTSMIWDGGFPSGEFRLDVRDPQGRPIKGAVLHVYRGGTRLPAFQYPLDNHLPGRDLASNDSGRITAIRKYGGFQFGGHAWRLYWVIPIGAKAPEYDCEITAEGYKPCQFSIWRLFESPYGYYEDFPKTRHEVNGEELEFKVYEHTFTLQR